MIWLACFSISSFFTPLNWLWCRLPRRLSIFFRAIGTGALLFSSIDAIRGTCFFVGSVDDFPKDHVKLLLFFNLLFPPPLHKRFRDNELMCSPSLWCRRKLMKVKSNSFKFPKINSTEKLSIVAKIHHQWSIFNFPFLQISGDNFLFPRQCCTKVTWDDHSYEWKLQVCRRLFLR